MNATSSTPAPAPAPTLTPAETLPSGSPTSAAVQSISPASAKKFRHAIEPSVGRVLSLSDGEQAEFMACEEVVRAGGETFVQVGLALARIRDGQLYRDEFTSFEEYYRAKWDFEHAQIYHLIGAAQIFNRLSRLADVPKPDHESQVRPLIGLEPDGAQAAWQRAASISGGRKITARLVKRAVRELKLSDKPKSARPPVRVERTAQREAITGVIGELLVLISQRAAYDALLQKVQVLDQHFHRLFSLDRKH
jgi:hypothetical protein